MSQSQYSLAWESFKTNLCSGFSALQQNGEFVDMTLAADGHLVKVHQVLIALSSSYLKKLILSAPCQHPVIFLNNISHKVLCYLLEYIYTGEVLVPSEHLTSFSEAAKALHIKGLENVNGGDSYQSPSVSRSKYLSVDTNEINQGAGIKRKADEQMSLPSNAKKVFIKPEGAHMSVNQSFDSNQDYANIMDDSGAQNSDDDYKQYNHLEQAIDMEQIKVNPSNLLYTVSIRGSLQTILNRYIYNLHSTLSRTGVRRWRCVDYRNNKCNAFLVTKGNVVIKRAHLHNHPFHDKKILSKIEKKSIFSALDEIEAYKEKEKALESEGVVEDGSFTTD